jgi:hypothetical protein
MLQNVFKNYEKTIMRLWALSFIDSFGVLGHKRFYGMRQGQAYLGEHSKKSLMPHVIMGFVKQG